MKRITNYKLQVTFNNPPRPSGTPPFKRRGISATLLLFCFSALLLFCPSALIAQTLSPICMPDNIPADITKTGDEIIRSATRGNLQLGYCTGIYHTNYGSSLNVGTSYISACVTFTPWYMSNYAGTTLYAIEAGIAQSSSLGNMTNYRIWIKKTLNGPVVYEQDVTAQVTPGSSVTYKTFTLNTPYAIEGSGLVLGYTVGFNLASAGSRYPRASEIAEAPYPTGAYNFLVSTNMNGHGDANAIWSQNNGQALMLWGHLSGELLTNNSLCAAGIAPTAPLKVLGNPAQFNVIVFNSGKQPQNNYAIQLLDKSNNILVTQPVTTAINSGEYKRVLVSYTLATAINELEVKGKVVLTGDENPLDDISTEYAAEYFYPMKPMAYCNNSAVGGFGSALNTYSSASAAIEYPVSEMESYAGKKLTAVRIGINDPTIVSEKTATLWIRSSLTGANLYSQTFTPVKGWNTIILNTPYTLQHQATFIGYTFATTAPGYALGFTGNTPNVNQGRHYNFDSGWTTIAGNTNGHFAIIGVVNLAEPGQGVTIALWSNPVQGGTLSGGGAYNVNDPVAVNATANPGFTFINWIENGNAVSSNPSYTFTATTDRNLIANFKEGVGVETITNYELRVYPNPTTGQLTIENGELKIVNVEIYDVYGRKQKSRKAEEQKIVIYISDLANGVYFLKISTEKGTVVQKIVKQ